MMKRALELFKLGYKVFPVDKNKLPVLGYSPSVYCKNEEEIRSVWNDREYNIAIWCGNIFVLDADVKDGLNGIEDICFFEKKLGALPRICAETPGSGRHYFFKKPPGSVFMNRTKINLSGKKTGIDIRNGNAYVVAAPSIGSNGKRYRWTQDEIISAENLPELPENWIKELDESGHRFRPKTETIQTRVESPKTKLRSFGNDAIDDVRTRCRKYVDSIPSATQGNGGRAQLMSAMNVIFGKFDLSYNEGVDIAEEYNRRCDPPWDLNTSKDSKDFYRTIESALSATDSELGCERGSGNDETISEKDYSAVEKALRAIEFYEKKKREMKFVEINGEERNAEETDATSIDPKLMEIPGLVSMIVEFCRKNAPKFNRGACFTGACAFMSYLIGQKVKTETDLRSNVYLVSLAPSSMGKEFIRSVVKRLMNRFGETSNYGEAFTSGEAIEDDLFDNNRKIYLNDEFDMVFRMMANSNESFHQSIIATLLKLYGISASSLKRRSRAGSSKAKSKKDEEKDDFPKDLLLEPFLTVYGSSQPTSYYNSFNRKMLEDGLLSRIVVVEDDEATCNLRARGASCIDEEIVDEAGYWNEYEADDATDFLRGSIVHYNPQTLEFTEKGRDVYEKFFLSCHNKCVEANKTGRNVDASVWGRATENMLKFAMIYACSKRLGRDKNGIELDEESVSWACEFIEAALTAQLNNVKRYYYESEFEENCNNIVSFIEKKESPQTSGISVNCLARKFKKMSTRNLKEAIETLISQQRIFFKDDLRDPGFVSEKFFQKPPAKKNSSQRKELNL